MKLSKKRTICSHMKVSEQTKRFLSSSEQCDILATVLRIKAPLSFGVSTNSNPIGSNNEMIDFSPTVKIY